MATLTGVSKLETGQVQIQSSRVSTARFDWTAALLSAWVVGGTYLDGWAHNHGKVDDVFFTPWHAVLYSGVFVFFLYLIFHQWRSMSRGNAWKEALPAGYTLSLLGVFIFLVGGALDFLWHTLFGTEVDLETLLSPTHLLLATSGMLMISGPIRAAQERLAPGEAHGWKGLGPMILSTALVLSLITFFTPYAHPINHPYAEKVSAFDQGRYDDLYIMNADGSNQTRLTASPDLYAWGGVWSPDSRQIVFSRGVVTEGDNPESALYLMNADGSDIRQLTDLPGWEYIPAWSPDGKRIAFIYSLEDHAQIYVINADGTGLQKLTDTDAPKYAPVWSPDGTQIVYTSNASGSDQLYIMNADGSGQTQITSQGSNNWGATWSPDGSQILFHSNRSGNTDIYTIHPDGTGEQRLTRDEAVQQMPTWSPDGLQIAFVAREDKVSDQIFVMNADGSNARNLTVNHAFRQIIFPRWSPDGNKILYTASGYNSLPDSYRTQSIAIASIVLQSAFLMGVILILVKRWPLPFGALTLLMTLNGSLMTMFHDRYEFVLTALIAGLVSDILMVRLKPSEARQKQFHIFAFAVPVIFYSLYFLTLQLSQGIDWTLHLWLGSIFLAGIAGIFASFLVLSPLKTGRESASP